MNNALHAISQLSLKETREAINLGKLNYSGLTDEAKAELDARMKLLLEHRDNLRQAQWEANR